MIGLLIFGTIMTLVGFRFLTISLDPKYVHPGIYSAAATIVGAILIGISIGHYMG
jgi:uncharacterized membrane protein YedE/YeeE